MLVRPIQESVWAARGDGNLLAPIREAVQGCENVIAERTTFYGAREIGVRAPGGFVVVFAAHN